MPPITKTQLENAGLDAESLADVINGSATVNGNGVITTRLGRQIKTLAKVIADLASSPAGDSALAQINARLNSALKRNVATVWGDDWTSVVWPEGTDTVLQRQTNRGGWLKLWASIAAPSTVDPAIHKQSAENRWWHLVYDSNDMQVSINALTSEVRRGRTVFFDNITSPSGVNVGPDILYIIAGSRSNEGQTYWRVTTAPANGLETDNLKKDGSTVVRWWRKVTDSDLSSLNADRISNILISGFVRVNVTGGTDSAIIAEKPIEAKGIGLGPGASFIFRAGVTNSLAAPTITLDGVTRTLRNSQGNNLPANYLVPNCFHIVYIVSNGAANVTGIIPSISDYNGMKSKADANEAQLAVLSPQVATLAAKPFIGYALQTSATRPVRPDVKLCHFYTWDDVSDIMQGSDLHFQLPSPAVPSAPNVNDFKFLNGRDGQSAVLRLTNVHVENPPILFGKYRLGAGSLVSLPNATGKNLEPGDYIINQLTQGQSYVLDFLFNNFVGDGVAISSDAVVISDANFSDNFNRANGNVSNDARWIDTDIGGNNRKMVISSNVAGVPGTNEPYTVQSSEYFPPNQFAEMQILGAGTNTSSGRGAILWARMPIGITAGYALRLAGNSWSLYKKAISGTLTALSNGVISVSLPVSLRIVCEGSTIKALIGGVQVAEIVDTDFSKGSVGFSLNAAGGDGAGAVRIDNFSAGRV